jgi:hypothetical protein
VSSPIWGPRPDFCYCQTFAVLSMGGALSDERTGLSFMFILGHDGGILNKRSHPLLGNGSLNTFPRHSKHVSTATYTGRYNREMFEAVFSMQSVPTLYRKGDRQIRMSDCQRSLSLTSWIQITFQSCLLFWILLE